MLGAWVAMLAIAVSVKPAVAICSPDGSPAYPLSTPTVPFCMLMHGRWRPLQHTTKLTLLNTQHGMADHSSLTFHCCPNAGLSA